MTVSFRSREAGEESAPATAVGRNSGRSRSPHHFATLRVRDDTPKKGKYCDRCLSVQDAGNSLGEFTFPRDETHHQVTASGKIEEMAGMDVDITVVEQFDREIFIGHGGWNTQHSVPAPFDLQAAAVLLPGELRVQFGQVTPHACPNLSLKVLALL